MHTETYETYMRLLDELNELISKNLGDSRAAEKVRDLMDGIWYHLSETEQEEINRDIKLPSCFLAKSRKTTA